MQDWKVIREKNAQIAELVFGQKVYRNERGGWSLGPQDWYDDQGAMELFNPLSDYYGDMNEAWRVIDKVRSDKCAFSIGTVNAVGSHLEWVAKWEFHDLNYDFVFATAATASEAICEATLKLPLKFLSNK